MKKYITVLDFEAQRVFQYKLKEPHRNEDGVVDHEEFISNKGHRLSNIEWMAHEIAEILGPTIVDIRSERLANNDNSTYTYLDNIYNRKITSTEARNILTNIDMCKWATVNNKMFLVASQLCLRI